MSWPVVWVVFPMEFHLLAWLLPTSKSYELFCPEWWMSGVLQEVMMSVYWCFWQIVTGNYGNEAEDVSHCFTICLWLYPPHNKVIGGYIGFTPSVRPSICPSIRLSVLQSRIPCSLCSACNSGWIHFIFTHLLICFDVAVNYYRKIVELLSTLF